MSELNNRIPKVGFYDIMEPLTKAEQRRGVFIPRKAILDNFCNTLFVASPITQDKLELAAQTAVTELKQNFSVRGVLLKNIPAHYAVLLHKELTKVGMDVYFQINWEIIQIY